MKNLFILLLALFVTTSLVSQELNADDRVNITQSSKPFIGVYAFGYQGLPTPGYPQFQLNNYGGVPGSIAATSDNSILGMFAFSGHNGSAKKTVGIIRVKSMDNFASALSSRMDFLIGPNREQRMTILGDTGYVGIGTETPTHELDVNGKIRMQSGATAGYIPVSDADGVMTWTDPSIIAAPSLWTESGSDITRSSGNVGIGTTSPTNELDVNGKIRMQSGATDGYIAVSDADGVMTWTDPSTITTPSLWTEFGSDTYRSTGEVGIGGTPNAKLHIRADGTSITDGIRLTSSVNTSQDWYTYMNASDDLIFQDDALRTMTFQNGTGNVGIGTESPSSNLEVSDNAGNTTLGIITNSGTNTYHAGLLLKTNTTANDEFVIRKYGSNEGGVFTNGVPLSNLSEITTGVSAGALYTGTRGANPVYIAANGKVAMYVDTDQDIGVNTQNPDAQMHIVEETGNNAYALYGESTYTGNTDKYGVAGESVNNPGYGYGGYFKGGKRGVYGVGDGGDFGSTVYGLHGYATGTAGGRRAVMGQANNPGGNNAYGLYGVASNASINYGVYGSAIGSGIKWAGYFDGNTLVRDTLTVEDRIMINTDEDEARLNIAESTNKPAVIIENEGVSGTFINGEGLEVSAGYIGIKVNVNKNKLDGTHYGYFTSNYTGTTELTGGNIGVYAQTSGARESLGGNYSIYSVEGGTAGSGENWAGYFAGDVRIMGTLDNASDARLKRDVENMENALDIIKQLQPKTYEFKTNQYPHMALDGRPQLGFIAQDMEKVLPQLVKTAAHPEYINDGEEDGIPNAPAMSVKSINYIGIIPVLTQGIKELTAEVEGKDEAIKELMADNEVIQSQLETVLQDNTQLNSELATMKEQMSEMANLMNDKFNQMEEDMSSCCFTGSDSRTGSANTNVELNRSDMATLEQNSPNPFNEQTVIKYYIPSFAQKATMTITDIKGSPLKSVNLEETGLGTVTINANELPIGTYVYTLYVDGRQVESKQMVLIK